ncbi:MAG: intein-containing RctB family protein [Nanoarchaeota archaeon]|nr:intein-containing RctB family protein [Nanoarchaeota archaeon]
MKEIKEIKLKKISDVEWEIPKGVIPNMNVPGRVFASEKLLEKMKQDRTLIQGAGVATLPGIYKYSIILPDGHEGYGFPIGGVAALDFKEGGISPGGIGYDINCLAGDSKVMTEFGCHLEIKQFKELLSKYENNGLLMYKGNVMLKTLNGTNRINMFMWRNANEGEVKEVKTSLGFSIKATLDHPFLTKNGMIELKDLKEGDLIAIDLFEGVPFEEQDYFVIIDSIEEQIAKELSKRELFPLDSKNPKLPIIARLFGYLLGDGTVYFSSNKGFVNFYGQKDDLEKIKQDLERLGFKSSIYKRNRKHAINTQYGEKTFNSISYELHCSSKALAKLFEKLGFPIGSKVNKDYKVPDWILNSKPWIKRLFLAGLFGAELSTPRTHKKTGFDSPVLSLNKNKDYVNSGRRFLIQIMNMLEEFGVSSKISQRKESSNRFGEVYRLRLIIGCDENNLLNLWRKIGYEYNLKRQIIANIASYYILLKKKEHEYRKMLINKIKKYKSSGLKLSEVKELLKGKINERFIERHFYSNSKERISLDFVSFNEFLDKSMKVIETHGALFDRITSIKDAKENIVYDFNVDVEHNFIANGFIVSNCGVRLIRTNLEKKDVEEKIEQILNTLFKNVPSGLGSKGKTRVKTQEEFDEVLRLGARWAVEKGFGTEDDLKHIEEEGCLKFADPKYTSKNAKKRGMPQLGSLGAGNHFLEIQYVDKIFDEKVAKVFGIEKEGQVTVMVHTGSRGFGHQVCSDYLREMEKTFPDIIKKLPDRELIYAPAESELAEKYLKAMSCAANFAWANRHMIMHWTRESFEEVFKKDWESLGMKLVYDVAHNIAKIEEHKIDGKLRKVYLHRKGATRAFGPGRPEIPSDYRDVGQPVLIPGSMGTASYVLVGSKTSMEKTFGSTAHGAGRMMSRHAALKKYWAETVKKELGERGIIIKAASKRGVAEEAPGAYKDIDEVARVSHEAGIGMLVARLKPMGVVKG